MKFRGTIAAAALAIGALTVGSTVAHAEEAPAPVAADQGVSYSVKLADKTVVATLRNGTFELTEQEGATPEEPKQTIVNVKDVSGATLIAFPLEFSATGTEIPVKPEIKEDGKVLAVTPEKPEGLQPIAAAVAPVAAAPIASPMENQRAMNEFSSKFGLATAIGGFIGTAIGLLVGCFAGLGIGCLPGAGIGGIIGTIIAGGPTLVAAGVELLQTLQAPDGTTKWAN
ncbi:hypothetical protein IU501_34025 [Nocardia otitidiscaviarum]|uniref:hypothetical protein n=1 Tax=Nocardia otitidiscaviarum TaxID=1823 RepID=UPI0004A77AB4|nr:hypothetical protein [Nocardia otitidiscaviarum]MBF6137990.1 hypothetical protein [Nocardia otitidiscaviarum]MBF6241747.1 hypothetical protein [Nocardia otitidiscaviarum]MBF6489137.1 hypothetical protein [Nocardia otitidiscaviarum]